MIRKMARIFKVKTQKLVLDTSTLVDIKNIEFREEERITKKNKELIEYIAKSLVDHPEEVQVSEVEGEQTTVLELKVAKEDLGKVIGKQGRTARAMRTILSAASIKCKKRTVLEIME